MKNHKNSEKVTMKLIRSRKQELEGDIELLERGFENRFSRVSKKFNNTVQLKKFIKKSPFIAVAAATGLGLIVGLTKKKKKVKSNDDYIESPDSGITSLIYGELKRVAARKAVHYISDLVDRKVSSYQDDSEEK